MIIPPFEAFFNVRCSDFGKWIPGFYLNHGNIIGFLVINQNLFISNYLWKEFWISLKHLWKVLNMCSHDSASAPHSAHELWIWWQLIHVQIVFKNCLNWPNSSSQNFSSFMDTNFFIKKSSVTRSIFSCILLADKCLKCSGFSTETKSHSNLANHSSKLYSSHYLLSARCFQKFVKYFSKVKGKFNANTLLF